MLRRKPRSQTKTSLSFETLEARVALDASGLTPSLAGRFDANTNGSQVLFLSDRASGPSLRAIDPVESNLLWRLEKSALDNSGWLDATDVCIAGDFGADGIDDIVQFDRTTGSTGPALRVVHARSGAIEASISREAVIKTANGTQSFGQLISPFADAGDVFLVGSFTKAAAGRLEGLFFNRTTAEDKQPAITIIDLEQRAVTFQSQHDGNVFSGWRDATDEAIAGDLNNDGLDDLILVNRVADPTTLRDTNKGFIGIISFAAPANATNVKGFDRFFEWNFARAGEAKVFPGYDDQNDHITIGAVGNGAGIENVLVLANQQGAPNPATAAYALLKPRDLTPGTRDSFQLIATANHSESNRRSFESADDVFMTNVDGVAGDEIVSCRASGDLDIARTYQALSGTRLSTADGDVVFDWNRILQEAVRFQPAPPTLASRNMAIVQIAVADAVAIIDKSFAPYLLNTTVTGPISVEAAVIAAAHRALFRLYPDQVTALNQKRDTYLARIADGPAKTAGIALGELSANTILEARGNDGFNLPQTYTPGTQPGNWRPTTPDFRQAVTPRWGEVTPFGIADATALLPRVPPALTSDEYAAAFNRVKSLGDKNSTTRTADQTEIGIFWGYDRALLGPPPVLYNRVAVDVGIDQGNTLAENARMLALVNIAQADGGVVAWKEKYKSNLWRPITAIREADTDGNPNTVADANWLPLGAPAPTPFTPPFPAYVSGHATFGEATFRAMELFYGRDDIAFEATSEELPGVVRSYTRFSQASDENAQSRIYLGIHWDFDATEGINTGRKVADEVVRKVYGVANA